MTEEVIALFTALWIASSVVAEMPKGPMLHTCSFPHSSCHITIILIVTLHR